MTFLVRESDMKNTLSVVLAVIIVILFGYGFDKYAQNQQGHAAVNTSPQLFFTVYGKVSPALAMNSDMSWIVTYHALAPACKHQAIKNSETTVTFDAEGNYQLKLPLDGYLSGRCDWQVSSVSYTIVGFGNSVVNYFDNSYVGHFTEKGRQLLVCNQAGCHIESEAFLSESHTTPIKDGLEFELNIH